MRKLDYTHDKEKRHNNPPAGIAPGISKKPKKKSYYASLVDGERLDDHAAYPPLEDPHDYPVLEWFGKHETDEIKVEILPLHVHESIHPAAIIRPAMDISQSALDDFFGEQRPFKKAVEFYEHEDGWTNRMIQGDSLQVMTSLIENEPTVVGRVQMIYFDPPYGIKYKSNFQPFFTKNKNIKNTNKNKEIEWRPEPITAFRDTWDFGVHSYLTTIRKRLLAAREILADTGSIFFQISNENVHRVRLLLDEIFGADNFMWEILFQTTGGSGQGSHPTTHDYILWYAKDKDTLKKSGKLHQLYLERTDEQLRRYSRVHMSNGNIISMPKDGKIPRGGRRCRADGHLDSQHVSTTDRSDEHKFPNGRVLSPPLGYQWRVGHEELDDLYHMKRLHFTENFVYLIVYPEDYPTIMSNVWARMMISTEKIYDVQTKSMVLERCITMCSDPGDLVLDITGGSGVTAYAAEKHGRRWITCDVSKLSIAIATCRMQTATFPWYKLKNKSAGICGGLKYNIFMKLSAGTLSNEDSQKIDYRYDKPIEEENRSRITGPFTVEAVPSPIVLSEEEQTDDATRETWADALLGAGLVTNEGRVKFKKLDRNEKKESPVHYIGTAVDGRSMAISFGPRNAPMDAAQVESTINESRLHGVDSVLMVATVFGSEAKDLIWNSPQGTKVIGAEANSDLLIPELKTKGSDDSFIQIGRPRFDIVKNKDGTITVKVLGYDYFDAESGKITSEGADEVAMWMLDTDYDGRTMRIKQMFFPGKHDSVEDLANKLAKAMRSNKINVDLLKKYTGTESLSFKPGKYKQIAVKTIDYNGRESKYSAGVGSW